MQKRILSNESISFQNDSFGKDLEAILTDIQSYVKNNKIKDNDDFYKNNELIKNLSRTIFNRVGLTIEFNILDMVCANTIVLPMFYFIPNILNVHNNIKDLEKRLNENIDEEYIIEEIKKEINIQGNIGYINLKDAKVSGIFSERICKVFINFNLLLNTDRKSVV